MPTIDDLNSHVLLDRMKHTIGGKYHNIILASQKTISLKVILVGVSPTYTNWTYTFFLVRSSPNGCY